MRLAFALLFLLACCMPLAHAATLNRCIGADGISIFTDQRCQDIGASVRPEAAPESRASGRWRLHANGCAHTSADLLRGLKSAFDAGDVNQVAAFYHWPGISAAGSILILNRLQALINHPIESIALIRPQQAPTPDTDPAITPQLVGATALELVTTHSDNDTTPVRTDFALVQYMGCWWVRF
ncbi:MAG: hypothetical protein ABI365_03555 [Lysobacteraceae bacterium]